MSSQLKLFGGPAIKTEPSPKELFAWPYVNQEIEDAVLDVVRRNAMSANDITYKFEEEFAKWQGRKYAIAYCNGTLSLLSAMFAVGLGAGDEIICPAKTYWASCMQAALLGASVVFANVKPDTLCIDPDDLERCLGPRTKAIMVVKRRSFSDRGMDSGRLVVSLRKEPRRVSQQVQSEQHRILSSGTPASSSRFTLAWAKESLLGGIIQEEPN